jgi:hypothetical protein
MRCRAALGMTEQREWRLAAGGAFEEGVAA